MSLKINMLCFFATASIFGDVKVWEGTISGSSWNYADHWSPQENPKATDTLSFETISTYPKKQFMVSMIAPSVVGALEFENGNGETHYHLFGKVPLKLDSPSSILIKEGNLNITRINLPLLLPKDTDIYNRSASPLFLDGPIFGKGSALRFHGPGIVELRGEESNSFQGDVEIYGGKLCLNKENKSTAIAGNATIFSGELEGASFATTSSLTLAGSTGNAKWSLGEKKGHLKSLYLPYSPYQRDVMIDGEGLSISDSLLLTDQSNIFGNGTLFLIDESSVFFEGTGGNGTISSPIDLGGTRIFKTTADSLIIDGKISNGTFIKKGRGSLLLTEENSYGNTLIEEGTLIASSRSIPSDVVAEGTLHLNQEFNGILKGELRGTGSLLKTGNGELHLNQRTPFEGNTLIKEGAVRTNTKSLNGELCVLSSAHFDQGFNGIFNGQISGSGTITKTGSGSITFTNENPFSGKMMVTEGSIEGTTKSLKGPLQNDSFVTFNQDFTGTYQGTLSGRGNVEKKGEGTLVLDKENFLSGPFHLKEGKLALGHSLSLGRAPLAMEDETILALVPSIAIKNRIDLAKEGTGILNIPLGKSSLEGEMSGGKFVKTGAGSLEILKGQVENLYLIKGGLEISGSFRGNIDIGKDTLATGTGEIIGEIRNQGTLSGGRIIPEQVPFDLGKAEELFFFEKPFEEEIKFNEEIYLVGDLSTKSVSGKAKITGDVKLEPESTLLINFTPHSFSQIEVDGEIDLNSSTLSLEPFSGTYKVGKNYRILEGKKIKGEFGEIITPFPMINPIISYNKLEGNVSLLFEMGIHHFSDLFPSGNVGEVARCLDYLSENPFDNSATVISALMNTQGEPLLKKGLDQMHPSQLTSLSIVQQNDLFYLRNGIFQRLFERQISCNESPLSSRSSPSIWSALFGGYTLQKNQGGDPGYVEKTPGIMAGVDGQFGKGTTLGGLLSYAYNQHEWNASRGSAEVHNLYASTYGQCAGKGGYLQGSISGGYSLYDVKRKITFGPFSSTQAVAKSNFGGAEGSIDVRAGLLFPKKRVSISPFMGLDYMLVSHRSFTEKGAKSLNAKVEGNLSDLFTSEGGVEFNFCQQKDRTFLKGFIRLSGILECRFFGQKETFFLANHSKMITEGFYPTRFLGALGMGLSATMGSNIFAASYQGKSAWEFIDQSLTFEYLWKF